MLDEEAEEDDDDGGEDLDCWAEKELERWCWCAEAPPEKEALRGDEVGKEEERGGVVADGP
jgi:hypothetical protein